MEKEFTIDAVKMVRKIRDRMARQTAGMTTEELIAFFHAQSTELRRQFGHPPLPGPKPSATKAAPSRAEPAKKDPVRKTTRRKSVRRKVADSAG